MELSNIELHNNLDFVKLSLLQEVQQYFVKKSIKSKVDPKKYASRIIEDMALEPEIDSLRKHYQAILCKDEMDAIEKLFYSELQISVDDFRNEDEYSIAVEYCRKLDQIKSKLKINLRIFF